MDFYTPIFDELFPIGFGRPTRFYFNTNGLKDQMPGCWEKIDDGYRATVKTLGITEPKIEITNSGIKVSGENELYGKKYNTEVNLPIAEDILNNITDITYSSVAGLTFVTVKVNRPEKKKIQIRKA